MLLKLPCGEINVQSLQTANAIMTEYARRGNADGTLAFVKREEYDYAAVDGEGNLAPMLLIQKTLELPDLAACRNCATKVLYRCLVPLIEELRDSPPPSR